MKNIVYVLPFLLILLLLSCGKGKDHDKETSIKGWVPTYKIDDESSTWKTTDKDALITTPEAAAIIAKAAVISIYNEGCAEKEQPYVIVSHKDYWLVRGSMREGYVGGTFTVSIRKKDGKIEHYYHEK